MKRLLAIAALVLALSAGGAHGQEGATFSIVPGAPELPGVEVPNGPNLVLPPAWTSPPVEPRELSYDQLLTLWRNAGEAYGIPWNVLAAINKIESNFGRNMGPSSAGAIGWMQFMPSTWLRWGTDADGDGIANPWEPVDAVYSAARYLGAARAEHGGDLRLAVFAYNHAWWYVDDVMELAQLYGDSEPEEAQPAQRPEATRTTASADAQVVFDLDRLQANLEAAKTSVTNASALYQAAVARAQELGAHEQALLEQASTLPLLSDRLAAQKYAVQASFDREAADADLDRARAALSSAESKLQELEQEVRAASFNRTAAMVLQAPTPEPSGSYVFPVGGGPQSVSVSHFHHDYPAADIAAPMGAPLYALADGEVLYAWSSDERCGAGFTMKAFDGQVWTYCHLSYLDPEVQQGARLQAGSSVGLVGSTGNSTGPHLHLQLQPAASYPQEQPWFRSLENVAFRWQEDAETKAGVGADAVAAATAAAPTDPGPVFTIVEQPAG